MARSSGDNTPAQMIAGYRTVTMPRCTLMYAGEDHVRIEPGEPGRY